MRRHALGKWLHSLKVFCSQFFALLAAADPSALPGPGHCPIYFVQWFPGQFKHASPEGCRVLSLCWQPCGSAEQPQLAWDRRLPTPWGTLGLSFYAVLLSSLCCLPPTSALQGSGPVCLPTPEMGVSVGCHCACLLQLKNTLSQICVQIHRGTREAR